MKPRRPPRFAVCLLNRFGLLERNEAFAGDLAEEFSRGRSGGWFWRQTLVAVVIGTWANVRKSELQAVFVARTIQTAVTVGFLVFHGHPRAHLGLGSGLIFLFLVGLTFLPAFLLPFIAIMVRPTPVAIGGRLCSTAAGGWALTV